MPPVPTLPARIASYSVAAGATLALAPAADAQVVYTDVDPDQVAQDLTPAALDLDGDGTVDLDLWAFAGPPGTGTTQGRVYMEANTFFGTNGVFGVDAPINQNASVGSAYKLDEGDEIGAAGCFYQIGVLASVYSSIGYYPFRGDEGYVGFRFKAATGAIHYGWARVSASADATRGTLLEYAYESTPGVSILAGATSGTSGITREPSCGTGETAADPDAPAARELALAPVIPTPVAGRARVGLEVGRAQAVRVEVFDALGRGVAVLHDGPLAAGEHSFGLDVAALPVGVYAVRVTAEAASATRTLTVAR